MLNTLTICFQLWQTRTCLKPTSWNLINELYWLFYHVKNLISTHVQSGWKGLKNITYTRAGIIADTSKFPGLCWNIISSCIVNPSIHNDISNNSNHLPCTPNLKKYSCWFWNFPAKRHLFSFEDYHILNIKSRRYMLFC